MEARVTLLSDHSQDRVPNAACLLWPERPLPQGGEFVFKEGRGVRDRLLDGPGHRLFQH